MRFLAFAATAVTTATAVYPTTAPCTPPTLFCSARSGDPGQDVFTPVEQLWETGCALLATRMVSATGGNVETIILSASEGATYDPVRGLLVAIYPDASTSQPFTPASQPIMSGRVDASDFMIMRPGSFVESSWFPPVLGIRGSLLTGYPQTLQANTGYWLVFQQTGSSDGTKPAQRPYFQQRANQRPLYYATVSNSANGCPVDGYPQSSDIGAWTLGNANGGPFSTIKGIAFGVCDSMDPESGSCASVMFPASPSPTPSPSPSLGLSWCHKKHLRARQLEERAARRNLQKKTATAA